MVSNMMTLVEGNKLLKVLRDTASPKPGPGDIPDNMVDYMCSFAYDFIAMFNKMLPMCKIVIPDFIDGNGNNRVTKYQPQSQQTQRLIEKSRSSTPNNNFHPRNEDKKEGIKCHWCGRTNHPAQKCNLQGHPDANKDASTKWRESAGGLKWRVKRGDLQEEDTYWVLPYQLNNGNAYHSNSNKRQANKNLASSSTSSNNNNHNTNKKFNPGKSQGE